MTNEEKKAARRKRRAELGQDLFSTQARASANSPGEFSRRALTSARPVAGGAAVPLPAQIHLRLPRFLDYRRHRQDATGREVRSRAHLAAIPPRAREPTRRLDNQDGD